MQRLTIVRYAAKPDRADENETLSRAVFEELRATTPKHMAYAVFRDGVDFVHVFINAHDEDPSVLTGLSSFKAFSAHGGERHQGPPEQIRLSLHLLDSYGLAG